MADSNGAMEKLAELIERYMREKGLRDASFARRVGVTRATIGNILNLKVAKTDVLTFMKIARAMGMKPHELMGLIESGNVVHVDFGAGFDKSDFYQIFVDYSSLPQQEQEHASVLIKAIASDISKRLERVQYNRVAASTGRTKAKLTKDEQAAKRRDIEIGLKAIEEDEGSGSSD